MAAAIVTRKPREPPSASLRLDRNHVVAPANGVTLDSIAYRVALADASAGRKSEGLWRCLVLSAEADASAEHMRLFEKDLLLMPSVIPAIRNWAYGRVVSSEGRRRWSCVWEQEFDDIAGLEGDYMMHPIHWGIVDSWCDLECPQRIMDPFLIHAAFTIREAVIS